jgi:hypothetical protein
MQIIKNWLNSSQNFTAGATLYKAIGKNTALKNLLAKGETPFAKKLLVEELEKLATVSVQEFLPDVIAEETAVMEDSSNNVLQAIKNEWSPLYQRMNYLRHQLDKDFEDMNSPAAIAYRKPIAREILQLEQKNISLWKKRDYYKKHGKLPFTEETKIEIPTDPVAHAKLISNLGSYIRRYRKQMQDKPDDAKAAQLYNENKAKYLEVAGKEYEEKN